jgi:hypothetical protein
MRERREQEQENEEQKACAAYLGEILICSTQSEWTRGREEVFEVRMGGAEKEQSNPRTAEIMKGPDGIWFPIFICRESIIGKHSPLREYEFRNSNK